MANVKETIYNVLKGKFLVDEGCFKKLGHAHIFNKFGFDNDW